MIGMTLGVSLRLLLSIFPTTGKWVAPLMVIPWKRKQTLRKVRNLTKAAQLVTKQVQAEEHPTASSVGHHLLGGL